MTICRLCLAITTNAKSHVSDLAST